MAPSTGSSTVSHMLTNAHELYQTPLYPYLPTPLQDISSGIETALTTVLQAGDVVSLAAFLLCLYLTLRIADYVRRSLVSWLFFFIKIGLLLVAIQIGFYVHAYGGQRALRDAGWLGGLVWGFVEEAMQEAQTDRRDGARGSRGARDGQGWNFSGGRQQVPVGGGRGRGRGRGAWT